jgi:hypothetical protein
MLSIVPNPESPLYFVLCDFGPKVGKAYTEVDPECGDRDTVVKLLASGEYTNPQRVIEVDISGGTSRDVTHEILEEVEERSREHAA